MELLYGMDPLCGWCFGIGPALRQVMADHPGLTVTPVLGGLVTGERVGPYAKMEGYIRGASQRLLAVTGQSPSPAFFDLIRRPDVIGNSGPPSVAIAAVRAANPGHAADFALRVTDAHFEHGADLGLRETYTDLLAQMGLATDLPDLARDDLAHTAWTEGRDLGLTSFPTLWLRGTNGTTIVPLSYRPSQLSSDVASMIRAG
jgi:putative protein-disulfide isomerase